MIAFYANKYKNKKKTATRIAAGLKSRLVAEQVCADVSPQIKCMHHRASTSRARPKFLRVTQRLQFGEDRTFRETRIVPNRKTHLNSDLEAKRSGEAVEIGNDSFQGDPVRNSETSEQAS